MNFKRNPEKVRNEVVVNSGGQLIAKSACRIHTPVRFVEKDLSRVGVRTYVFGWLPIILDSGDYMVMNVCARVETTPTSYTMVEIDGTDYYEFYYEAGSVIFPTDNVVQDDKIIYFIIDEMIFQAKKPWYMDYNDLGCLLDSSKHYADSRAAAVLEVIELATSVIARLKGNEEKYLRHEIDTLKDKLLEHADFIPLTSVHLTVTGTVNRIAGNYFEPAIEGALVTPSKKTDTVEQILRA